MWDQNGWPRHTAFDTFKSFNHEYLMAKHCYIGCSKPPNVDEIKNFDKDDQATKHCSFTLKFCGMMIFTKNVDPINIRQPWALKIMFCLKPIKSSRVWPTILISHLFCRPFVVLGHPFFTLGVLWFRYLLYKFTV